MKKILIDTISLVIDNSFILSKGLKEGKHIKLYTKNRGNTMLLVIGLGDLFPDMGCADSYLMLLKLLSGTNLHFCNCRITKVEFAIDVNINFLKYKNLLCLYFECLRTKFLTDKGFLTLGLKSKRINMFLLKTKINGGYFHKETITVKFYDKSLEILEKKSICVDSLTRIELSYLNMNVPISQFYVDSRLKYFLSLFDQITPKILLKSENCLSESMFMLFANEIPFLDAEVTEFSNTVKPFVKANSMFFSTEPILKSFYIRLQKKGIVKRQFSKFLYSLKKDKIFRFSDLKLYDLNHFLDHLYPQVEDAKRSLCPINIE